MNRYILSLALIVTSSLAEASNQADTLSVKEKVFVCLGATTFKLSNLLKKNSIPPQEYLIDSIDNNDPFGINVAINLGAKIDGSKNDLEAPLERAIENLTPNAVDALVRGGCSTMCAIDLWKDLSLVSTNIPSYIAILTILLNNGLSINAQGPIDGNTILGNFFLNANIFSVSFNNSENPCTLLRWLYNHGATYTSPKNTYGKTPLDLLMETTTLNDKERFILLNSLQKDTGKDKATYFALMTQLKKLLKTFFEAETTNIDFLIALGIDFSDQIWIDEEGFTPFAVLCLNNHFIEALKIKPRKLSEDEQKLLNAKLFSAPPYIKLKELKTLLKLGANKESINKNGITPFEKLCFIDISFEKKLLLKTKTISKQLQNKLNVELVNLCNIPEDSDKDIFDIVGQLLSFGALPNSVDKNGTRAIDLALDTKNRSYFVAMLLNNFGGRSQRHFIKHLGNPIDDLLLESSENSKPIIQEKK